MAYKCTLLLVCCCLIALTVVAATTIEPPAQHYYILPTLVRQARSPKSGSLNIDYNQNRFGKSATLLLNRNLYTSRNGRFSVDAYAQASRHFTQNRNSYGGGIRGSFRF